MSVETWKKEFYPVQVKDNPKRRPSKITKKFLLNLLDQAILKWTGLLPKNRKKHNVDFPKHREDLTIYNLNPDDNKNDITWGFHIDGTTCSLCAVFDAPSNNGRGDCVECPLYLSLGNNKCTDIEQPYYDFMYTMTVQPMVRELKKARKYVEEDNYF